MKPKKPSQPWKNLEDCFRSYSFTIAVPVGKAPCPNCRSRGQIVAPWEQPDPCEGYKMAERITCELCKGEKFVSIKVFKDKLWAPYRKRLKAEMKQYREEMKVYRAALKKLTLEERKVLGVE